MNDIIKDCVCGTRGNILINIIGRFVVKGLVKKEELWLGRVGKFFENGEL